MAPLQRAVYDIIRETEGQVVQLSRLMATTGGSQPGIRKAIKTLVLEGLCEKEEVRQKDPETGFLVQGLRFVTDPSKTVKAISLEQAHYVQKRGGHDTSPARLSVSLNINIQTEQVVSCLTLFPEGWGIKSRTLRTVADQHLTMTALELRYSILELVAQVQQQSQPLRHPNAYVTSAFRNGPLVTETDIQARLEQRGKDKPKRQAQAPEPAGDLVVLRRYLTASPEERTEIDRLAKDLARPALAVTGADKHAGILEEARLDAARQYFAQE